MKHLLLTVTVLSALGVSLTACGSSNEPTEGGAGASSSAATTFSLPVAVRIKDDGNGSLAEMIIATDDEVDCQGGSGPYDFIKEGTKVTVRDASGAIVGLGALGLGKAEAGFPITCILRADIQNVPDASAFYSVQIGDDVEEQFTVEQAKSGVEIFISEVS